MTPETARELVALARTGQPREVCGFVVVEDGRELVVPVRNTATSNHRFEMDHSEQLQVIRAYEDILGVWHSHPQGQTEPSGPDKRYAPPGLRYWIITLDGVYEWEMEHDRTERLHAVLDDRAVAGDAARLGAR